MSLYQTHILPNGIKIVHKQVSSSKIAHVGFVLDIGSRDEQAAQIGIAHFWEHMAFKGTQKRKAFHILNKLDVVGGDLNAYTTKEKICFYASVLTEHFEKAVDLLSDITFHSVFPEKEIEKERGVILEEMSMYLDDPVSAIQDHFDEVVFGDHPLGKNIAGTPETVAGFSRANFVDFVSQNLHSERIVFSSVSNLPLSKVVRMAEKYLLDLPKYESSQNRLPFQIYKPKILESKKPITQAHCLIGCPAYPLKHPNRLAFYVLTNLLGGSAMNSRLNMSLREKYGLVYSIEANYTTFVDTALFSVYFGTDPKSLDRCIELTMKELAKIRTEKLSLLQLQRCKQQLRGQLAMAEEHKLNEMLMMGKGMLDMGEIETLEQCFAELEEITPEQIQTIANETLQAEQVSRLTYLPSE